jgi:diguanylate cyclase (GGDEF)-like protein
VRWRERSRGRARDAAEPLDRLADHLRRLLARLGLGLGLAVALFVLTLGEPAATEVSLALAYVGVVLVASWRFRPPGQWTTVALAAIAWTTTRVDLRGLEWPPTLPPALWRDGALRLGVLASAAGSVSVFRHAMRRLLRTEDALALTLLRERDSARRDRLTRLWNSRYLVVDLDGFKAVNDTCGHDAGDTVLQIVGRVLRENCRATDIPARIGGDEFAVILPEASSLTVPRYAAKLVDLIGRAPFPAEFPPVTASVGAVAFARAPDSAKAALAVADEAMYAAKREGKNRFAVVRRERSP